MVYQSAGPEKGFGSNHTLLPIRGTNDYLVGQVEIDRVPAGPGVIADSDRTSESQSVPSTLTIRGVHPGIEMEYPRCELSAH